MDTSIPIVVDLDGTLIKVDSLAEASLVLIKHSPWMLVPMFFWLLRGRLHFKLRVFVRSPIDGHSLPLNDQLFAWIKDQKNKGHKLYLATASAPSVAQAVANRLNIFEQVFASSPATNLKAEHKAELLVRNFGEKGFIYAGNSRDDLYVFKRSKAAVLVSGNASLLKATQGCTEILKAFPVQSAGIYEYLRAIRVHQWAKNVLIFLPPILGHRLDVATLLSAGGAFVAFSSIASAIYLINDMLDLEADRQHPSKSKRALASGTINIPTALALTLILLTLGISVSLFLNQAFFIILLAYIVLTNLYSFYLKRIPVADVLILAGLYTTRLIAGSLATEVYISTWLLSVSMFFFLSLAFMKRVAELKMIVDRHRKSLDSRNERFEDLAIKGRGYLVEDLGLLNSMGAASGFLAVMVFSLYISSSAVQRLYQSPVLLWFICPFLLYWLCRSWLITNRGMMRADPVAFALTDRISYLTAAAVAIVWIAAWVGVSLDWIG